MAQQQQQNASGSFSLPFVNYQLDEAYDEMFTAASEPRIQYHALFQRLLELQPAELKQRQQTADIAFLNQGITFTAYGHERSATDATHAWIEAFLPEPGWVGFDPTNNLVAGERHIRTAIGRDYADVPPTRGVFKGIAQSELSVGVQVSPTEAPPPEEEMLPMTTWIAPAPVEDDQQQQQQQQQ